jgi:3-oxoacyl-(acyl-carrier-protein) synthase
MKRRRVKITGIGPVTPAGIGREAFWKGILEPVSRVSACRRFEEGAGEFVAAEVKGFKLPDIVKLDWARNISRMSQLAVAGTVLALRDADISLQQIPAMDPVVMVGSAMMDPQVIMGSILDVQKKGARFARPRMVREAIGSATSGAIVHTLGINAQVVSFQTACCAGLDAIGFAAEMIGRGEASLVIAGGTEAPIYMHPMLELKAAGLAPLTHENAAQLGRPFDLWRTTGVIGEGACFFILEPEESPRPAYAFVNGFGYANDNNGDLCGGLSRAIRAAIANSSLSHGDIDCISAWGPGHREIDAAESAVLRTIFGARLGSIPTYSIKGAIGNPFAAAGAIQVAAGALSLKSGMIPPTVNWQRPDPACALNLSARSRWVDCERTMIDAHGVSGTNSCLILERC